MAVIVHSAGRQRSASRFGNEETAALGRGLRARQQGEARRPARLITLDNQIDQTTGTIKFKSQFDNQDMSLWPNQFVNVRLYLSVKKDAIVVSSAAIQKGVQDPFVYVIGANNDARGPPRAGGFHRRQCVRDRAGPEGRGASCRGRSRISSSPERRSVPIKRLRVALSPGIHLRDPLREYFQSVHRSSGRDGAAHGGRPAGGSGGAICSFPSPRFRRLTIRRSRS